MKTLKATTEEVREYGQTDFSEGFFNFIRRKRGLK